MERKKRVVPREVSSADETASTNAYGIRSNNEWREVSRGHSTIVVANMMGRAEL